MELDESLKEIEFKMVQKLKTSDYRKIAKKVGLDKIFTEIYVKFMKTRFPNEFDKNYATEWAERFKTGYPMRYMDNKSRKIYLEILNKGMKKNTKKGVNKK